MASYIILTQIILVMRNKFETFYIMQHNFSYVSTLTKVRFLLSPRPSLSRWSGHSQPATTGRVKVQQDEEGSFIGRYLAKQITLRK